MKRCVFIGEVGAGKTTLFNALQHDFSLARKTQAVEFSQTGNIDTPGEYFSHPRLYHALINTLSECDLFIYVHPANELSCRIPAGMLTIYSNLKGIAVISKIDLPDADVEGVKTLLRNHGFVEPFFPINSTDEASLQDLRTYLCAQGFYNEEIRQ